MMDGSSLEIMISIVIIVTHGCNLVACTSDLKSPASMYISICSYMLSMYSVY